MVGFSRKKGWAWEQLAQEEKGLFLDLDTYSLGERVGEDLYHADCLFFLRGKTTLLVGA